MEAMKLSPEGAAEALGLSTNTILNYRRGRRAEGEVTIPKVVQLACLYLARFEHPEKPRATQAAPARSTPSSTDHDATG